MNKNLVVFLFFALFIVGCQQNVISSNESLPVLESEAARIKGGDVESDDPENESESATSVLSTPKTLTPYELVTHNLLDQGERALASEQLLTPENDNANLYFQVALGRDPGNYRAIQGIANIVDIYTDWAWIAAKGRDYQKAERYLDYARSVNPEDPLIVEMTSRITGLKTSPKRTVKQEKKTLAPLELKERQYILPKTLFSLTEDEIITEIQPIIDIVSQTGQSLEIYWPNDKEARLLYQIINSRIPKFRVRAMTYRQANYMVELQPN